MGETKEQNNGVATLANGKQQVIWEELSYTGQIKRLNLQVEANKNDSDERIRKNKLKTRGRQK